VGKKISVITPVYNEEENIESIHNRLKGVSEGLPEIDWEFIFVDDASEDQSFAVLRKLVHKDVRIHVIRLSRNFGTFQAIMAGFTHCTGDYAVNIAADFQDPPELIPRMLHAMREGKADIVWAVRKTLKEALAKRFVNRLFYWFMRKFALPNTSPKGADIVLLSRKVIDTILLMKERNLSLFSLILWSGFQQTSIGYDRPARHSGASKWTLGKRLKLGVDSIVSFSTFPIRLISVSGMLISAVGFLFALKVIIAAFVGPTSPRGWASLMVVILVLSGLQLLMLGIVAEYLWRTFTEVQPRPPFIVSDRLGFPDETVEGDQSQNSSVMGLED